ncbi:MAG: flagellar biosynthesis protein FlhF [Methylococcaceae bacterium]|nr:flagellar biosynthesis protein FlhF [Methylococcaceae bacterium]
MKIKRFVAKDIRQAMRMVKEELGADAVIMSNKSVDEGVEIVAARDFDEETVQKHLRTHTKETSPKIKKKIELANFDKEKDQLHVVTSSRKIGEDGVIPKRSSRRNIDQYVGYAEKVDLVSKNKAVVTKPKPAVKKIASPDAAKQFSFETMKEEKTEPAVSESFMQEMRDEIKSLKAVFNTKLSEASWAQGVKSNPVRVDLLHKLSEMEISKQLAIKIANRLDSHKNSRLAFKKAKDMLSKVLPISNDNLLEDGGIVALVGPTGVGKTTTIAKLAAKYILKYGSGSVALITTDNHRVGAHEQLNTYAKLLDVPMQVATNADELRKHINHFNDKQLILIDTAGMSQRDMRLADQIQTLQQHEVPIKTYLVMSASTQQKAINEIIRVFKVFEPEASILTKLDETVALGSTLSVIIEHQLPIAFMTNGQQVPEDIYYPDSIDLINQSTAGLNEESDYTNDLSSDHWVSEGYA